MTTKQRLLIVDDEPEIAKYICDVAQMCGYETQSIQKADEFEALYSNNIDVIILDLFMPECDGVELLRFLAAKRAESKIILISGYDIGVLHSAKKLATEQGLCVIDTLCKPIQYDNLKSLLSDLPKLGKRPSNLTTQQLGPPTTDELEQAFQLGEIEAYFQPQLNIADGTLAGFEALVRWNHPTRGLITPDIIIPLTRQTGMISRLTTEMLEQSLNLASAWNNAGIRTRVAINAEASNFWKLNLPELIDERIKMHQLDPEQIVLEVTESSLMQELIKSLDVLTRLRIKGVNLSIDDFGTGYSSLLQLYRIPFSEMKIDRSFVMQATVDAEALAIVEMIIMLGHKLGIRVVAEGVENQETWSLLASLGCDVAQGYFISRPMRGQHLQNWYNDFPG